MTDDWRAEAECRGLDPSMFFPGRGDAIAVREALAVCFVCPVKAECLATAVAEEMDSDEIAGIRGGTTAKQRRLAKWPATTGAGANPPTCSECGQRFPHAAAIGPHMRWTHRVAS